MIEQLYTTHQKLIYREINNHRRRCGCIARGKDVSNQTVDELESTANAEFVRTYHSWKPDVAMFSTWLVSRIRWGLRHEQEREQTRKKREGAELPAGAVAAESRVTFDPSELNEDAKTLVSLVLCTPPEIVETLRDRRVVTVEVLRAAIRRYLLELGWDKEKITQTFQRVREAL